MAKNVLKDSDLFFFGQQIGTIKSILEDKNLNLMEKYDLINAIDKSALAFYLVILPDIAKDYKS